MRLLDLSLRTTTLFAVALAVGCSGSSDDDDDIVIIPDAGVVADAGTVEPECTANTECTGDLPFCNADGECAAPPAGGALGWGDGSVNSVTFELVYSPTREVQTPDLEFHPSRTSELWLVHREPFVNRSCTQQDRGGCASLEGSTTTIQNAGQPDQSAEWKRDGNAWHFMRRPPSIAFSADNDNFGTCGEAMSGNFLPLPFPAGEVTFIGPSLWSSDPAVYAITPPGGNGSHLDMLHETPMCTGMAWEQGNAFWAINGETGSLDRWDFVDDHGPGADDHSDGTIFRYALGTISIVPNVPSHLAYDSSDGMLYVVDTGNKRIIKLDTNSGTRGGAISPIWEPLADQAMMDGAVVTDVVAPGTLDVPSGLELHDGLLYVTDTAQSRFYAFDLEGNVVRTLQTALPMGELAGMAFGPDGLLYFSLLETGDVYRIIPR